MHQLLSLKVKIWIVVGLAAMLASVTSWLGLHPLAIGTLVGILETVILLLLFHSWESIARVSYVPRPAWMSVDLTGKWTGEIRSQWEDEKGASPAKPIPVVVDVRQTWQEVVFSMETDRMRSRSIGTIPTFDAVARTLNFRYFFETEPTALSTATNPPQRLGAAVARFRLGEPNHLSIIYTNERGPGGDISLTRNRNRRSRRS
jgi:SMODS-associating 2TM, beta-strand rich effector domain